jgi:hypothetical protein
VGESWRSDAEIVRGLVDVYPQRAIITSDDSVAWSDDDWARQWLDENGM